MIPLRPSRARIASLLTAVVASSLISCTTPDAVSAFCASASTTLTSATPVFEDMELSCLREVNSREEFGSFKPPAQSDPNCARIGVQAAGAKAAAKILTHYFRAINALASFGTAKAGSDTQNLLTQTSAAFGANSTVQGALGSVGQFLVTAATSAYKQKQLDRDLTKVSANISAVANALVTVVQDDYIGRQLFSEEQKLTIHYREFARASAGAMSPQLKLTLDDRWRTDEAALEARRSSAQSLVSALQTLSQGFADLAANSPKLKAKGAAGLLQPYVSQLQTLIPQIHKAF